MKFLNLFVQQNCCHLLQIAPEAKDQIRCFNTANLPSSPLFSPWYQHVMLAKDQEEIQYLCPHCSLKSKVSLFPTITTLHQEIIFFMIIILIKCDTASYITFVCLSVTFCPIFITEIKQQDFFLLQRQVGLCRNDIIQYLNKTNLVSTYVMPVFFGKTLSFPIL